MSSLSKCYSIHQISSMRPTPQIFSTCSNDSLSSSLQPTKVSFNKRRRSIGGTRSVRSIRNFNLSQRELSTLTFFLIVAIRCFANSEAKRFSIHNGFDIRSHQRRQPEQRNNKINYGTFDVLQHFNSRKISSVFHWSRAEQEEKISSDAPTTLIRAANDEPTSSPTDMLPTTAPMSDMISPTTIPISAAFLTEQPTIGMFSTSSPTDGFNAAELTSSPTRTSYGSASACSIIPGCTQLEGNCCPTVDGQFLDCCFQTLSPTPGKILFPKTFRVTTTITP